VAKKAREIFLPVVVKKLSRRLMGLERVKGRKMKLTIT